MLPRRCELVLRAGELLRSAGRVVVPSREACCVCLCSALRLQRHVSPGMMEGEMGDGRRGSFKTAWREAGREGGRYAPTAAYEKHGEGKQNNSIVALAPPSAAPFNHADTFV